MVISVLADSYKTTVTSFTTVTIVTTKITVNIANIVTTFTFDCPLLLLNCWKGHFFTKLLDRLTNRPKEK